MAAFSTISPHRKGFLVIFRMENVPNPDGRDSLDPPLNFTRLGIRVPTIMISPWINKGTVVHRAEGNLLWVKVRADAVELVHCKLFDCHFEKGLGVQGLAH